VDGDVTIVVKASHDLLRQQTRTKSDIGQLLEVFKSQGAKALKSIQDELNRLEREDRDIQNRLAEIERRREPMQRISEDAKAFVRTWEDVGELLEAATQEERQQLLHHYVEVIEMHA
jgi:chaperonin cofactor prefoldin